MPDLLPPAPPYPPTPVVVQSKTSPLTIILLVLLVVVIGFCALSAFLLVGAASGTALTASESDLVEVFVSGRRTARHEVVVIPIEGVIMEGAVGAPWGPKQDLLDLTRTRLERATREDAKAVILEVNSPGGAVTASDELYRMVVRFREEHGVPVVVQMKDVAASGGYYVAAAADWIVAAPSTITASIGVILSHLNVQELMEGKLGIRYQPVTSAPRKDILSPFRDMAPEERGHLQEIVDQMYDRFVEVVVQGRRGRVTEEEVRALQSTILSGEQALARHLVDQLGYLDAAVAKAKELAAVEEVRVVRYDPPPTLMEQLFSALAHPPDGGLPASLGLGLPASGSPLMFLWAPGL